MTREAAKADQAATHFDIAAQDARRAATTAGPLVRAQYLAMDRLHRENAAEYRHAAVLLRDGEIPEGW